MFVMAQVANLTPDDVDCMTVRDFFIFVDGCAKVLKGSETPA